MHQDREANVFWWLAVIATPAMMVHGLLAIMLSFHLLTDLVERLIEARTLDVLVSPRLDAGVVFGVSSPLGLCGIVILLHLLLVVASGGTRTIRRHRVEVAVGVFVGAVPLIVSISMFSKLIAASDTVFKIVLASITSGYPIALLVGYIIVLTVRTT